MSEVFVARQPIFDRRMKVAGYELLFRGGPTSEAFVINPEGATASVVLNAFTEIGLERIVGSHPAWVNVSREFVLSGLAETVPAGLIVLEILEDQVIDEQLIVARCARSSATAISSRSTTSNTRSEGRAAVAPRRRGQARPPRARVVENARLRGALEALRDHTGSGKARDPRRPRVLLQGRL